MCKSVNGDGLLEPYVDVNDSMGDPLSFCVLCGNDDPTVNFAPRYAQKSEHISTESG